MDLCHAPRAPTGLVPDRVIDLSESERHFKRRTSHLSLSPRLSARKFVRIVSNAFLGHLRLARVLALSSR